MTMYVISITNKSINQVLSHHNTLILQKPNTMVFKSAQQHIIQATKFSHDPFPKISGANILDLITTT